MTRGKRQNDRERDRAEWARGTDLPALFSESPLEPQAFLSSLSAVLYRRFFAALRMTPRGECTAGRIPRCIL